MLAEISGPPTDFCFQLIQLQKTYRVGEETITALQPTNLIIPWNRKIALLGYSGHGKSTLLNLLGLLDSADASSGDLRYRPDAHSTYSLLGRAGEGVIPLAPKSRTDVQRHDFGFVFQFQNLLSFLNSGDNAGLRLRLLGCDRPGTRQVSDAALERLGLKAKRQRKPRELSGGECQRIAVLRALAHNPRVVLADEPTANLDRKNAERVLDALTDWQQNGTQDEPRTLLLATHDIGEAFRRCDCFLILRHGAVQPARLLWKQQDVSTPEQLAVRLEEPETAEASSSTALSSESAKPVPPQPVKLAPANPSSHRRYGSPERKASPTFLWELAYRDLADRWGPVAGSSFTLTLLVALAVVGWGLLAGKETMLRSELETPLARCLELDCSLRSDVSIDAELLAKLYALRLPDGRPATDSPPQEHIFPWLPMHLTFWKGAEEGPTQMADRRARGRTVQAGDPLLNALDGQLQHGELAFSADTAREILASQRFLEEFGYPLETGVVWVQHRQQQMPLRVVGVVRKIPAVGVEFLLPDGLYQQMVLPEFQVERHLDHVLLEGIPPDFELEEARQVLSPLLEVSELGLVMEPQRLTIRLPRGGVWPEARLRSLAREIDRRLVEAGLLDARGRQVAFFDQQTASQAEPDRVTPEHPDSSGGVPEPRWTHVTLVSRSVNELPAIVEVVAPLGLSANRQYLYLLQRLQRIIQPLRNILFVVVCVAAAVSAVNLWVTAFQRVQEKTYELGILKACGMSANELSAIFMRQGVLLGTAGSLLGIAIGSVLGRSLDGIVPGTAFEFPLWRAAIVIWLVLLLSVIACWTGTWRATRRSAAVALRR